ncbi:MAG: S-layer homology domain-containing protein [Andreesenia angusta]|nr:S-layer homology domain-containing protein [Andreesenia angusta]
MQKKALSLILLSIVGSSTTAMAFTDTVSHWAELDIQKLVEMDILSGYSDGSFNPEGNITRAETSKILSLAKQLDIQNKADLNITDMSKEHWSYDYVLTLAMNGIVRGYPDGSFRPDNNISREEFCIMIFKILNPELGESKSFSDLDQSYAKEEIEALAGLGIVSGYENNLFMPKKNITRAEAANMVSKTLKVLSESNIREAEAQNINQDFKYDLNEEKDEFIPSETAKDRSLDEDEIKLYGDEATMINAFKDIALNAASRYEPDFTIRFENPVNQRALENALLEVYETNYEGSRIKNISRTSQIGNYNGEYVIYQIKYKLEYNSNADEEALLNQEVQNIINNIISPTMDDQTKSKIIYDYIIKNTTYASDWRESPITAEGYSVYSPMAALKSKKALCNGYAGLFYKMAEAAGLDVRYEAGNAMSLEENEKHAWNKVNINGEWRYIDTTWADNDNENINYNYFLSDRASFSRDHTLR